MLKSRLGGMDMMTWMNYLGAEIRGIKPTPSNKMNINLTKDMIFFCLAGREKNDIISGMLDRLSESGKPWDR
jgi:hypothetical protein